MPAGSAACTCTVAALRSGASTSCIRTCSTGSLDAPGLAVRRWPNGAFGGNFERTVIPSLEQKVLKWPSDEVFSVEVLGTLKLPARAANERWIVSCEARGGSYYLWVEDHLVCEGGNEQPRWNPYRLESVLPFNHTLAAVKIRPAEATTGGAVRYLIRATFVRVRHHVLAAPHERPFLELRWQRSSAMPSYVWGKNRWQPAEGAAAPPAEAIPRSLFSTFVPTAQYARLTMQRELLMGYWGTWAERSVTAHTLLPFGVELRIGLCALGGQVTCPCKRFTPVREPCRPMFHAPMSPARCPWQSAPRSRRAPFASWWQSRRCVLEGTKQMVDSGHIRLGKHSTDHTYTQLYFTLRDDHAGIVPRGGIGSGGGGDGGGGVNISIETAQRGRWGAFFILARVVGDRRRAALASQATLVVSVDFAGAVTSDGLPAGWRLPGRVEQITARASAEHAITATADGQWRRKVGGELSELGGVTLRAAVGPNTSQPERISAVPSAHLALRLSSTGVAGLWASRFPRGSRTLSDVVSAVESARRVATAKPAGRSARSTELLDVSRSAVMWNLLSRASLPAPQVQCARGWGRPWVAFMWDDAFAAMQLATVGARSLAYSQLATLLKGKLSDGFVPNMWMPNWISFDRSGPPVVAMALRFLYARYTDGWLVELLFDDIYAWLDWFWRKRRLSPLGLIALGSDPGALGSKYNAPSLKMAKLESGMDNSPMCNAPIWLECRRPVLARHARPCLSSSSPPTHSCSRAAFQMTTQRSTAGRRSSCSCTTWACPRSWPPRCATSPCLRLRQHSPPAQRPARRRGPKRPEYSRSERPSSATWCSHSCGMNSWARSPIATQTAP
jgi:hypothetical protein